MISTRQSFTRNNGTVESSSSPDTSPRYRSATRRSTTPEHGSSAASSPPGRCCRPSGCCSLAGPTLHAGVWRHWRRFVRFAIGLVTVALIGLLFTKALPTGVAAYSLGFVAFGVALMQGRVTLRP